MMTYIILSYMIMILREILVAYRNKKMISVTSALWVAGAPITLPLTIVILVVIAYKEVKRGV